MSFTVSAHSDWNNENSYKKKKALESKNGSGVKATMKLHHILLQEGRWDLGRRQVQEQGRRICAGFPCMRKCPLDYAVRPREMLMLAAG